MIPPKDVLLGSCCRLRDLVIDTTQKKLMDKISTISFREPGSTMIGNQIVEILQSDQKLSPLSELLLFYV